MILYQAGQFREISGLKQLAKNCRTGNNQVTLEKDVICFLGSKPIPGAQFEPFLGQNIIRMDDRTMPPSREIIVPEGIPNLAVEWIYKLYKGVIHPPFTGQPKNRQCMQT
jgi:hypothetical protein